MKTQITETFNWLFGSLLCTTAIVFLTFGIVMAAKQVFIPAIIDLLK